MLRNFVLMNHQCAFCSCEIRFRVIRGTTVPLHDGDHGCLGYKLYRKDTTRVCHPTICRGCKQPVFFVRHNNGSVWFDPPLGHPWPKHECSNPTKLFGSFHRQDWPDDLNPYDKEALQADFDFLNIKVKVHNLNRERGLKTCFIAGTEPHVRDAIDLCRCQKKRIDVIYHIVRS